MDINLSIAKIKWGITIAQDTPENPALSFFKKAGALIVTHPHAMVRGISTFVSWSSGVYLTGMGKVNPEIANLWPYFMTTVPVMGIMAVMTHMDKEKANQQKSSFTARASEFAVTAAYTTLAGANVGALAAYLEKGINTGGPFMGAIVIMAATLGEFACRDFLQKETPDTHKHSGHSNKITGR